MSFWLFLSFFKTFSDYFVQFIRIFIYFTILKWAECTCTESDLNELLSFPKTARNGVQEVHWQESLCYNYLQWIFKLIGQCCVLSDVVHVASHWFWWRLKLFIIIIFWFFFSFVPLYLIEKTTFLMIKNMYSPKSKNEKNL